MKRIKKVFHFDEAPFFVAIFLITALLIPNQ